MILGTITVFSSPSSVLSGPMKLYDFIVSLKWIMEQITLGQYEVGMLPLLLRSALSIDPDRNLLQITPYFIQSLHSQS
jgi:hypothetical protein